MLKEIATNPVILGLVAGAIVYAYLSWTRKKENERRLKKGKKIKDADKYDDIIIPIIVAVLVWFIAIGYINYKKTSQQPQQQIPSTFNPPYNLIADEPSIRHGSFTLVKPSGITIPSGLSQMPSQMPPRMPSQMPPRMPSQMPPRMPSQMPPRMPSQTIPVQQSLDTKSTLFGGQQTNLVNPPNQINSMNVPDIFID
jgi:hypothetical protein